MLVPPGATIAVADGAKLSLFHNAGHDSELKLTALPHVAVGTDHKGSDHGHQSSPGNPAGAQLDEDGFSGGVVEYLNKQVLEGHIKDLVIIAAPRALGELRKHYHKQLSAQLVGEIAKEMTGSSVHDIEKTIAAA